MTPAGFFFSFYSCMTLAQQYIAAISMIRLMLSMGNVICAGIVPELRFTPTASSGIKCIRETHGQEDEQ